MRITSADTPAVLTSCGLGLEVDQLLAPPVRRERVALQRVDEDDAVGGVVDALAQRGADAGGGTQQPQDDDQQNMSSESVRHEGRGRLLVADIAHGDPHPLPPVLEATVDHAMPER